MSKMRIAAALLSLSAAGLVGIVTQESYTEVATPPVKGDVPTYGFGTTTHPDGSPVKLGERTTPVRALIRAQQDVSKKETAVRKCLDGALLTQGEWDIYIDHAYNVGEGAFCTSQMAEDIRAARYIDACNQFLRWRFYKGKDCSLAANKKLCGGLWARRQESQKKCLAEQQP